MDDLNLDIRSYTIEDLEGLFTLNTFEKYREEDIEKKELVLINKTATIANKETKKKMLDFIKTAKEILIKEKCKPEKVTSDKVMQKKRRIQVILREHLTRLKNESLTRHCVSTHYLDPTILTLMQAILYIIYPNQLQT